MSTHIYYKNKLYLHDINYFYNHDNLNLSLDMILV